MQVDDSGPACWMNRMDAMWLRQQLRNAGIQSRLLAATSLGLYIVQALPELPRPSTEKFCPPELDDG
jgi:hypothetical protein